MQVPPHTRRSLEKSRIHGGRRLISQPKDNDARGLAARGRKNVSEIQIECKHNSALRDGFRHDLRVGKTNEIFVAEVDRIVICRSATLQQS